MKHLIENGANVNYQNKDGDTPLHWAIFYHKIQAVKSLESNGKLPSL